MAIRFVYSIFAIIVYGHVFVMLVTSPNLIHILLFIVSLLNFAFIFIFHKRF